MRIISKSEWFQRPLFYLHDTFPTDDIYLINARWKDFGFKLVDDTPHLIFIDGRWVTLYPMCQTDIVHSKEAFLSRENFYRLFGQKLERIA